MSGNNIYNNYINNTGGGIYTRYQKDMEIIGNVIINSSYDSVTNHWATQGGGIIFAKNDAYQKTIMNANIKVYNNTIADNSRYGIENFTSNNVNIKNNIISNNNYWHIRFLFPSSFAADTSCHIDNNLYYSSSSYTDWMWNGHELNFSSWKDSCKGDGKAIINKNPSFVGSGNYNLQYGSPAKNAGVGLQSEGVITDILNNPRPYWNKDYDIGAYEVQGDAQLKIGIAKPPSSAVHFTISSPGMYWERNSGGYFIISSNSTFSTSSCKV